MAIKHLTIKFRLHVDNTKMSAIKADVLFLRGRLKNTHGATNIRMFVQKRNLLDNEEV